MTNLDDLIKETLVFTAQKGWTQSHAGFFPALVQFLGEKLGVEYALVDELLPDQNMPGMTGVETLQEIRASRPDLPVILSSGRVDQAVEGALSSHPRVWLLRKPFDFTEMQAVLRRACP